MNKFERWLYVLFDKKSNLKDLINIYKDRSRNLERIRKEKEIIEVELNLIKRFEEDTTIYDENEKIKEQLNKIINLNDFKKIKKDKFFLELKILEKKLEKRRTIENIVNIENSNKVTCYINKKIQKIKNILKDTEITENKLLYCEKELVKLNYNIDKEINIKKDKEENKIIKWVRTNKILDSIIEGYKINKILIEKKKNLMEIFKSLEKASNLSKEEISKLQKNKKIVESKTIFYSSFILLWSIAIIMIIIISLIGIFIAPKLNAWNVIFLFFLLMSILLITILSFYTGGKKREVIFITFNLVVIFLFLYLLWEILNNFWNLIPQLVNLYFIENTSEYEQIDRMVIIIIFLVFLLYFVASFYNWVNIFKIENLAIKNINFNFIIRVILLLLFVIVFHFCYKIEKNVVNNSDFIIDSNILIESKGMIILDEEKQVPIKIIKSEDIFKIEINNEYTKGEEPNLIKNKTEEGKILNCDNQKCEEIGNAADLKNKKLLLFNSNICENKMSEILIMKCLLKESSFLKEKKLEGRILKGKIENYGNNKYKFEKNINFIDTSNGLEVVTGYVYKISLSIILLVMFYFIFKGNKEYYENIKEIRENQKEKIKKILEVEMKEKDKKNLIEEINELKKYYQNSLLKIIIILPSLAKIWNIIFNFLQTSKLKFKINFFNEFSIIVFILAMMIVSVIIILDWIFRTAIDFILLPKNEFFEFTEIILEIAEENEKGQY